MLEKVVSRKVVIALSVIVVVLVSSLIGVIMHFTSIIQSKDDKISNLCTQITTLNANISELENKIAQQNKEIIRLEKIENLTNQIFAPLEVVQQAGTEEGGVNLASSLFPNAQSWSLDTANRRVVVNLPWNAYTIPYGVIYVPTELADTWVYYPPKANVKITSVAWETGESIRQISETAVALVNVIQKASVKSSFRITASASVPTAMVSPAEQTFTLEPNATMTVRFNVQNLGVQTDTDGYITFVIYETWTGTETDRNSNLRFKLLAASTTTTILDVLCVDKETGLAVSGIIVYVSYGSGESKNGITGANGMATFDLGNYRGQATISSLPTDVYKQSTLSVTVSGRSSATLYLEKQGKGGGGEDWWIYVLIGIVIVMAVVLVVVVSKKRSKMRRR